MLQQFKIDVQPYPAQWIVTVPSLKIMHVAGFRGRQKKNLRRQSASWIERCSGGWEGHLIGVADGRWLIDASADQCASIEHGFEVAPEVLVVDLDGVKPAWTPMATFIGNFTTGAGIEIEVQYRPMEEGAEDYLELGAWHDEALQLIVGQIVKAMRSVEVGVGA